MKNSLVLLMAGSGTRSGLEINKVLYQINQTPLFMYSLEKFRKVGFDEYILVVSKNDFEIVNEYMENTSFNVSLVIGGSSRCESVRNALKKVTGDVVVIHDAARPLINIKDIENIKNASLNYKLGTMYHHVTDTIRKVTNTVEVVNRDYLYSITTPQFFHKSLFNKILNNKELITDEITLFENEYEISFIKETTNNLKLTTKEDIEYIEYELSNKHNYSTGHSLDYHPFDNTGKLILGGITFDEYPILHGHSDADVVLHAVTESLLGAANLGDLGTLFPDTDPTYKGYDSSNFLKEVVKILNKKHIKIQSIDVMVYLIKPSLKNYKTQMAKHIKDITNASFVCIKAATLNKRGLISLEEGIGAEAISLIKIPHNK